MEGIYKHLYVVPGFLFLTRALSRDSFGGGGGGGGGGGVYMTWEVQKCHRVRKKRYCMYDITYHCTRL